MNPPTAPPVETYESLSQCLDYHLLEPTLTTEQLMEGCRIAKEYGVRAIVVRPCDVEMAVRWTNGSGVIVASVTGYPDGVSTTAAKLYEGRDVLRLGARELDFVINPARMLSREFQHVETELMQISRSCHESRALLKIVYNNRWFAEDTKIIATKICRRIEADMISIDHSDGDFTLLKGLLRDVLTMKRATVVTTLEEALAARDAGYIRIATTTPAAILDAWKQHLAAAQQPTPTAS